MGNGFGAMSIEQWAFGNGYSTMNFGQWTWSSWFGAISKRRGEMGVKERIWGNEHRVMGIGQ